MKSDRWFGTPLALYAFAWLVAMPYLFLDPGYVREDWQFLARAEVIDAWHAGDPPFVQMRPLGSLLYAFWFGTLGDHPVVGHALLIGIAALIPPVLYCLLSTFVATSVAIWVAVVWTVLPTHSTLDHWTSAVNVTVSLVVLLFGLCCHVHEVTTQRRAVWSTVLFVISGLCYGATLPVALLGILVAPKLLGARIDRVDMAIRAAIVLVVIAYVAWASTDRSVVYASIFESARQNLIVGRVSSPWIEFPLVLVLVVGAVMAFRTPEHGARATPQHDAPATPQHGAPAWQRNLLIVGAVVFVVGFVPFLTTGFDAQFIDLGDRANMVSSIGAAMMLVSITSALYRLWRPLVGIVIPLVGAASFWHVQNHVDWANTARTSLASARHVERHGGPGLVRSFELSPESKSRLEGVSRYDEISYILRFGILGRAYDVRTPDSRPPGTPVVRVDE